MSSERGLRPGVGWPAVAALMVAAFGISTAYGMLLLLPLRVRELGGDESDFGVVVSSAAVTAALCLLALARYPEVVRPAWVLVLAIGVFGAGAAGAALVTGSWLPLVGVGVLLGTAWATVYTVAPMVISAMVTDAGRTTYFGYLTGSQQLGIGAGPVLAGILVGTALGFRGTFAVAALICVLAAGATVVVAKLTPDVRAGAGESLSLLAAAGRIARSRTVVWLVVIALFACQFTALTQFQTTFAQTNGLDYSVFYVSYTVAVVFVRFVVAPWTSRFDTTAVIAVSVTVMTVAVAAFLFVGDAPVAYGTASALVGLGYGLALPAVQAHAVNVSDEAIRPRVLPIAGLVFQTAILAFPLVAGWMVAGAGYWLLFTVLVVLALLQTTTCWRAVLNTRGGRADAARRPRVVGWGETMAAEALPPLAAEDHTCPDCSLDYSLMTVPFARGLVAELPARVRAVALGVPARLRRLRPSPGTWSVTEYVCHLRDVHVTYTIRLHRTRTEDRPVLEPMLGDLRARRFAYNERDLPPVLDELDAAAAGFRAEIDRTGSTDWDRVATRLPGERRTARWLVRQAAHEGVHHLDDIRRIGHPG